MTVLITVPNQNNLHRSVVETIPSLASDTRYQKAIIYPALAPPYYNTMNQVAKMVLDNGYEWWLNIDSDNPPTRNPLDLVELGKDIIACPTPMWKPRDDNPIQWNVYGRDGGNLYLWETHHECKGLQKVGSVGSGCILIHRRVLEALKAPFMPTYNENGFRMLGPDTCFCARAYDKGFEIWAHFDYPCGHWKEINLLDVKRLHENLNMLADPESAS